MNRLTVAMVGVLPFVLGIDLLRSANRAVEKGNEQMKAGKPEQALVHYDEAVKQLPAEPGAHFDRGTALFSLSRYDEAAQEFLRATEAKAVSLKASAFYNLGNTFFKADKFGEAVEAYKRSLTLDPTDVRAKWNLELALKKKKDEDQKKKDEKKDDKDKDKDNKDKKDQQKPEDKKNEDKKKPEDKDDKQSKQDQQKPDEQKQKPPEQEQGSSPPAPERGADQRELDAILDSLERSPKALEQERARLRAVRRQAPVKDW